MIAATLFSGIGAPEVAMPHWRWAWHAEIEKFPSAVMAARHPESINLGDVSANDFTQRAAAIARPNVLVFGSPCQSFSVAGKRLGLDDPRGNLALVALGIVDRLKPDWFVFENVPGLLSSGDGRDFGAFLGTVADIGYFGCGDVLDAQWFGVAQRRQRVFFVGNSRDWRHSAAVLLEPESLCGNHPPRRQAGKGTAPSIAPSLTNSGRGVERTGESRGQDPVVAVERDIAQCLNAGGIGHINSEDGTGRGTPLVAQAYRTSGNCGAWDTGDRVDCLNTGTDPNSHIIAFNSKDHGADAGSIAPTLRAGGHSKSHANAGVPPAVAFNITPSNSNKDYNARESERSQALTRSGNRPSARGGDLIASSSVRRLTPRECERLQGFPDDYTLIDYRGKPAADGPRYKALGNSMAVPVVRWILNRIEIFETQVKPRIRAA